MTVMHIEVGKQIGAETHVDVDQLLFITDGTAKVLVAGEEKVIEEDGYVLIPAGAAHNVFSVGDEPLKLFSIYSKPMHSV